MTGKSASAEIDAIIAGIGDWRGDRLAQVRKLIRGADPDVVETVKYKKPSNPAGVAFWEHDGVICAGEPFKDKLKLTFARGAALEDPDGLFNNGFGGSKWRALDLREGDRLDADAFSALVRRAVDANRSAK
jgi:hypothetical protein